MNEKKNVSYEDLVIEHARQGFSDAHWQMDGTMEELLRLVYRAGVKQGHVEELERRMSNERLA